MAKILWNSPLTRVSPCATQVRLFVSSNQEEAKRTFWTRHVAKSDANPRQKEKAERKRDRFSWVNCFRLLQLPGFVCFPFESWSPRSPRHAIGVEPARVRKLLPATVTGTMGQQLNKCEWLESLLLWNYNPASVMYVYVVSISHVLTSNNIIHDMRIYIDILYIIVIIVICQESHWSSLIINSYPACSGPFHCMPLTACMPSAQICHAYRLPAHGLLATRAISQQVTRHIWWGVSQKKDEKFWFFLTAIVVELGQLGPTRITVKFKGHA